MASKRPHEGDQGSGADSGRARKKQKTIAARTIHFQTGSSSGAGVVPVITNSMTGLPGVIDVEKFTEARAFEIEAMQSAIERAKGNPTQRAWQTLPRSLRRRAASHDVRRVPVRLREKARAEMDPAKRKALGRKPPKRGKAKQITRTQCFLKRQRDKTWLETHLWHAKRMHMKNLWGYRLADTPTEKSFRPSHRASVNGSILHDASYMSIISVSGKQRTLERMLLRCCDCQGAGPGAVRYTLGSRVHETYLHEVDAYPFGLISPITIIWKTLPIPDPPEASITPVTVQPKKRRRVKNKEQLPIPPAIKPDSDAQRTFWMRFHPSAWSDVWQAVQKAASLTLDQVCKENAVQSHSSDDSQPGENDNNQGTDTSTGNSEEQTIELADLRSQVNCFEIMGPRSTQVLLGALKLVGSDNRSNFNQFWSQLKDLQTSGSVPRGMIIGMKVHDPRLNFPPKNAKASTIIDKAKPSTSQPAAFTVYPNALLARSELWDAVERKGGALRPRFKKKDLDERRRATARTNLIPGTPLNPLRQDDRVPILLIQHSASAVSPAAAALDNVHGWTLLLPVHWSMPFFTSLTHTGTRVGGLRERRTQHFEAGQPDFPFDFPGTPAYGREEAVWASVERARWERKPPGKRVDWGSVGTKSPWHADWETVLGWGSGAVAEGERGREGLLPTQRDVGEAAGEAEGCVMWLLRGPDVPRIVEDVRAAPDTEGAAAGMLFAHIAALRVKRGLPPLAAAMTAEALLRGALVPVVVDMEGRGAPEDMAAIYAPAGEGGVAEEEVGTSTLIGYVTTGSYSLSRGRGYALGAVALVELVKAGGSVKVKDRTSKVCRAARIQVLST